MYSEQQLWELYVRFNDAYFGNTLPLPEEIAYVERLPARKQSVVACVLCERVGDRRAGYRIFFLRPFFLGTDARLALSSLLHEMIHIHTIEHGLEGKEDHGPLFKEACHKLQDLGWNVDACLTVGMPAFDAQKNTRRRSGLSDALWRLIDSFRR